jgi:hypothetical protein
MSLPLISYIFKAALRDRIILSFSFIMVLCVSLSFFIGGAAITEHKQFTLVFSASGLRLAGMMGLVLFVVFFIRRSFDTKEVEFLLSKPLSRIRYIVSHFAAFTLLALIISILISLLIFIVLAEGDGAFEASEPGFWIWALSLAVEYIIMVNTAMFFAMVLTSAPAATLVTLAFYVFSRMIGQLTGIAETSLGGDIYDFLSYILRAISVVIPRLDLMGQSSWLIYGDVEPFWFSVIALQGIVFTFLIVSASTVDLVRRQF